MPVLEQEETKLYGSQTPTYEYMPPGAIGSYIHVAEQWLIDHGINLLPFQLHVLECLLSVEDEDMTWAYKNLGFCFQRQGGKTELIVAFILLRFYLFNPRDPRKPNKPTQIVYTAQHARSNSDIFARLTSVITSNKDLDAMTHIKSGKGSEEVIITKGAYKGDICKFYTRSPDAGRGTSTSVIIWDEAQDISQPAYNSISKTSRAAWNPVNVFLGTPPDEAVDHLEYFEGIRDAGRSGDSKTTAWLEWSPEGSHDPEVAKTIDIGSPEVWRQASPALGYFLDITTLEAEYEAAKKDPDSFKRESLAMWPNRPPFQERQRNNNLDFDAWDETELDEPLDDETAQWTIGMIVGTRGGVSALFGAVKLPDESVYVEPLGIAPGKAWIPDRLAELQEKMDVRAIIADPLNSQFIANDLLDAGIKFHAYTNQEVGAAFETFETAFNNSEISHPEVYIEINDEHIGDSWLEDPEFYESGRNQTRYWTHEDKSFPLSIIKSLMLAVYGAKDPRLTPKKPGKLVRLSYR